MKILAVSIACFVMSLPAADKPTYQTQEWMAKEYAQKNKHYIDFFSHCLATHNIEIKNKEIISFGCGTGEIEYQLAQQAKSVLGVDASNNMIEHAKEQYSHQNNLSFQYCPIEKFHSVKRYDLVTAFCSFNFFKAEQAIQIISTHLKPGGVFFGNIDTTNNSEPFGMQVFNDMKKEIPLIGRLLAILPDPTGISRHTPGALHIMFHKAKMNVSHQHLLSYEIKMTEQEWQQAQLPLLLSTQGAQTLVNTTSDNWCSKKSADATFWLFTLSAEEKKEHDAPFFPECTNPLIEKIRNNNLCRYLLNNFLKRCLTKMKKNGDGTYTWPYETTLYVSIKNNEK